MSVRASAVAILLILPLGGCARENPLFGAGGDDGTGGSGSTAGDDGRPTRGVDADSNSDSQSGADDASDSVADTGSESDSNGDTEPDGCLANFECLPIPGAPWQGPVAYSIVEPNEDANCSPGAYERLERTASVGELPPQEVPCCECEAVEAVCDDPVRIFSEFDGCSVESPSAFGDGTACMPTKAINAPWMEAVSNELDPPECLVTGSGAGEFDGLAKARICASDAPRSPCPGGQCVPEPAPGPNALVCVYAESEEPCPDAWSDRHELFLPETPACDGCDCVQLGPNSCGVEISRFSGADCAGDDIVEPYGGCNPTSEVSTFGSHVFRAVPGPTECLPMPGTDATSPVTRGDVWSVCCLE